MKKMKTKTSLKNLYRKITRSTPYLRKRVKCTSEWYGSSYGGFYVYTPLLNEQSIVYSFGIGEDVSFDKTINEKHGCHIYAFDPTPKSINWIKNQALFNNSKFHFYEFGINKESGFVDFYLPKNPEYVSGSIINSNHLDSKTKISVEMKSIKDILLILRHTHIDILKMDIEGSEYDVIEDILNADVVINQILIEFHGRFYKNGNTKTKQAVKKLKNHGYEIFAISNSFEEVSFINTKYFKERD
jgi:FkbM family methyltransferase